MRALGIGMIIVAIGIALLICQAGLDFRWTHHPPETFREVGDREDQMKIATSLGLAGNTIVLMGVIIFIRELFILNNEMRGLTVAHPTRFCSNCGRVVAHDSKFCPRCGKALPA